MKKAHRQERLLSSTLTESLILFLFILLAIADIYAKRERIFEEQGLIPPGHKAVLENLKTIDDDQVAISSSEYEKFIDQNRKIDEILSDKNEELNELREKLVDKGGVNPPPCDEFQDGKQVFFEVRFLPGKKYHLSFKNPYNPVNYAGFTVSKDTELILTHNEIRTFGSAVVASTRINKDEDFCCCTTIKNLGSSFCTKCVYVYEHKDIGYKKFSFSRVDGPTTAEMIKTVDLFFYRKK